MVWRIGKRRWWENNFKKIIKGRINRIEKKTLQVRRERIYRRRRKKRRRKIRKRRKKRRKKGRKNRWERSEINRMMY